MAGTAISDTSYRVHILGGDEGGVFTKLNTSLPAAIQAARDENDEVLAKALEQQKIDLLNQHPGFGKDLISYNMLTDSWEKTGDFPQPLPLTTTAVHWGEDIILPSGARCCHCGIICHLSRAGIAFNHYCVVARLRDETMTCWFYENRSDVHVSLNGQCQRVR